LKAYIEMNARFGKGYQVRVEDDGKTDILDFSPYHLTKAVLMAKKALDIANKEEAGWDDLKGILEIDRDSVRKNADYDDLSRKMASELGPLTDKGDTDEKHTKT